MRDTMKKAKNPPRCFSMSMTVFLFMLKYNVTWLSDGYVVNGTKMYSKNFSHILKKRVDYKLQIMDVYQFRDTV